MQTVERLISKALITLALCITTNIYGATFTWDGNNGNSASQTNWSTANNWDPNSAPSISGGHDLVFATGNKVTNNADGGTWTVNSVTFNSTAGAFTLGGGGLNLGAGGIVNNSTSTQTINNQLFLTANQTWNAASGAITSTAYVDANSKNLTLSGSSSVTMSGQVNNIATLTLSGSGNRTFGTNQVTASTVNVQNTGTNTFNGQLNATTLNLYSGTSTFANVQAGSGGIHISDTASANFTGPVSGGGGISIDGNGNVVFSGSINNGGITLASTYTGVTTITGTGSMSTGAVVVNGGTLILDHSGSGDAINNSLTVNEGGTVIFQGDNQIPSWQTVTLNEGSTLYLGDTTQTFAQLIITGDSVIDFGSGGSELNITYGGITIAEDITLTIINWNSSVDVFAGANPGDDVVVNVQYADSSGNVYATGTWGGGYVTPGAPVPEPATYGLFMLGAGAGLVLFRRRRASVAR